VIGHKRPNVTGGSGEKPNCGGRKQKEEISSARSGRKNLRRAKKQRTVGERVQIGEKSPQARDKIRRKLFSKGVLDKKRKKKTQPVPRGYAGKMVSHQERQILGVGEKGGKHRIIGEHLPH